MWDVKLLPDPGLARRDFVNASIQQLADCTRDLACAVLLAVSMSPLGKNYPRVESWSFFLWEEGPSKLYVEKSRNPWRRYMVTRLDLYPLGP